MATGVVNADGSLLVSSGPAPTVTHPGTGSYGFSLAGLGNGCPVPVANAFAAVTFMYLNGGNCGGGTVATTMNTGDGADHAWAYTAVGTTAPAVPGGAAARSAERTTSLPH